MNNNIVEKKQVGIVKGFFISFFKLFESRLNKIYKTKLIIWKLLIFLLIGFVVTISSFLLRDAMLNAKSSNWILIPNFININIVENTGIAFSGLSNSSSSVVYFVQSIPILIGGIIFFFSCSLYFDVGICLLFFGGLCNIIDRSIVDTYTNMQNLNGENTINAVVDYFEFDSGFINNFAVFNLPDVYIICGVAEVIIIMLITWIKEYREERNNSNDEPIKKNIIIEETK